MGRYKGDKMTIFTKYQYSLVDVEGYIIDSLTCSGCNLGLLLKILLLTTFMIGN